MKKKIVMAWLILTGLFVSVSAFAQLDAATLAKRQARKNLVIKEWNTDAKTNTKWLDHVTTYNDKGEKLEEIEYNQYGQTWRETYEYGENGKIVKNVHYDAKNKVTNIYKYEYNSDNTKKKKYNYLPNGKLYTVKVYEYDLTE
ncbi:MAG: hypothetical protein K5984_02600 [Bacteroidales bacterium]|nr:hypothetical protein [Bacteroidales bacterium]